MTILELEDVLGDILPPGFLIETNKKGHIVILTNLRADDDGELQSDDDDDEDEDSFDSDYDSLDSLDDEDD